MSIFPVPCLFLVSWTTEKGAGIVFMAAEMR
ncbi:hypothetical protein CJA_2712 [Cellvibrio japonicus Ueda107]|uniref:Uncharacterized protein n=1 Tax=Cellvibrio japonicus (strain Ueda107) TaxID=498211 RepID=B3PBE5_CELJU|nr:hypothetical protein CJA_2712 [Cellvibrio japonicus Ueda107]